MTTKALVGHSVGYVLARGLPGLINFLALALYTRLLTPSDYGQFASILAWVSLANSLFFSWLRIAVVRFLPAFSDRRKSLLSTVFVAYLMLLPISAVVWLIILSVSYAEIPLNLKFLGLLLLWAEAWFELNLDFLRAQLQPFLYGMVAFAKALLTLILGTVTAVLGFGAIGLTIASILGFALPGLLINYKVWTQSGIDNFSRDIFGQLLMYGLPLSGTLVLGFLNAGSDRLLAKVLLGDEAVAYYTVGYDLAQQTITMIFMVMNMAAGPIIIQAYEKQSILAAQQQYDRYGLLVHVVGVPATVGLWLVSEPLTRLVLGREYQAATLAIFPWIVFGAFLHGLKSYYVDFVFHLDKNTVVQLWTLVPSALANVIWNLAFMPRHGVIAAAHSTIISYAIGLFLSVILANRLATIRVSFPGLASACVVSLIMGAFVMYVSSKTNGNLLLMVGTGVGVYGLGIALLRLCVRKWA